ncbi:hypothetical protein F2Q70_00043192 [Brassica cretica]|uniref:Uncharacterized protein n=1 Tax=Brassica cretica TaxID=69181 RepID=A0A8S9KKY6_BRACR|nr:hypothetical protein F2Q70_00043192 [Brassica cretica]
MHNATDTVRPQSIDIRQSPSLDIHHHASIDNRLAASIDTNPPRPHKIKSHPDFHIREEIDQLVEGIYRALETTEERLDGRCRPQALISIDRRINKSIDTNHSASIDIDTNRGRLVPKTTSDMPNTPYHGKEMSADTYAALKRNQFNLESLGERLQMIENTTAAMKDKWRRGDEAMRDITDSTKDTKVDQPVNYPLLLRLF